MHATGHTFYRIGMNNSDSSLKSDTQVVTLTRDGNGKHQYRLCAATVTGQRYVQNHHQTGYGSHKHLMHRDENCTA